MKIDAFEMVRSRLLMTRTGIPDLIDQVIESSEILHRQLLGRMKTDVAKHSVCLCRNRAADEGVRQRLFMGYLDAGHISLPLAVLSVGDYPVENMIVDPIRDRCAHLCVKI